MVKGNKPGNNKRVIVQHSNKTKTDKSSHVTSSLPLQKDKGGIVMVNFYNDYVTCSKTAKISDVAGKRLL